MAENEKDHISPVLCGVVPPWWLGVASVVVLAIVAAIVAASFVDRYYIAATTVFFGLTVSLLVAWYFVRGHSALISGGVLGVLIGISHLESHLAVIHHWSLLDVSRIFMFFFVLVGMSLGSGGGYLRSVLDRDSGEREQPALGFGRQPAWFDKLLTVDLLLLAVVLAVSIFFLIKGDRVDIYLVLGFVMIVVLAAIVLASQRMFLWLTGFVAGYLLATAVLAAVPALIMIRAEFLTSLSSAFFFTVLGMIIGFLASAVIEFHNLAHQYYGWHLKFGQWHRPRLFGFHRRPKNRTRKGR